MIKKLFIATFIALFSISVSGQDTTGIAAGIIEYHDLFNTSMNKNVSCYRIPAMVTAPNGDLIAAIDERVPNCNDLNRNNDINIIVRRSTDNGKTWSKIETAVDFPLGKSASDPSMIVDKVTKEIFMFYNFMDLEKENGVFYLHVVKSSDNGKTLDAVPIRISDAVLLTYLSDVPLYIEENLMLKQSVSYELPANNLALPLNTLDTDMLKEALDKAVNDEKYEMASLLRDELRRRNMNAAKTDNENERS